MDTRTPILMVFGLLLAALSLSLLGLAADNTAFSHSNQNSDVDVHYTRWNSTANAQYSYWIKLDYTPSNLSLSREYAEIATGVICFIIGTSVAVGAWFARSQKSKAITTITENGEEEKNKPSRSSFSSLFLPIALCASTIAFIVSLALTVYTNQAALKWSINFKNSLPLPPLVSNPAQEPPTRYHSPFAYTPEVWNCALAPYVVSSESGVSASRMSALCQEAKAAKYLMIPLVLVAAVLVGGLAWMMWSSKKASAAGEVEMADAKKVKDVDEESFESVSIERGLEEKEMEKEGPLGWSS